MDGLLLSDAEFEEDVFLLLADSSVLAAFHSFPSHCLNRCQITTINNDKNRKSIKDCSLLALNKILLYSFKYFLCYEYIAYE